MGRLRFYSIRIALAFVLFPLLACSPRPQPRAPIATVPIDEAPLPVAVEDGPECEDASDDAAQRVSAISHSLAMAFVDTYDLDGASVQGLIFEFGRNDADGAFVYVRLGACSTFAGQIAGGEYTTLGSTSHGLRDIRVETPCASDACSCTPAATIYEYDGKQYRRNKDRGTASASAPCPSPATPGPATPSAVTQTSHPARTPDPGRLPMATKVSKDDVF